MIVPVILSGGSGSRLWPLSRKAYPKQLLPLVSGRSLLQDTLARIMAIPEIQPPLLIGNQEHRFLIAEQLQQMDISAAQILLEPTGRNTAPAVALAALYFQLKQLDPVLLVLPADHVIKDIKKFTAAVQTAEKYATTGQLVTFGVVPTCAETGYGYVKIRKQITMTDAFIVEKFIEKPDLKTAEAYLQAGDYYWNSGMFMFRASHYLAELKLFAPAILSACEQAIANMKSDLDFIRVDEQAFLACPADSIDYAVMEKTKQAVVVPFDAGWSDVGSWSALWQVREADAAGNVISGDVITTGVSNCYLHAESRMLAVVGVKDHVVVETADAVLVVHKDHSQAIKNVVEQLKIRQRSEADLHRRVYRPWGFYETMDTAERFLVKRIMVKPHARLSLQMHHRRSEHWVVVRGTANVTRNEEVFLLTENQSTYIPVGVKHRLENPSDNLLEIIEIQAGDYLGEDDIVRFHDVYGRDLCQEK